MSPCPVKKRIGRSIPAAKHLLLQLKPAHAGHAHVENDAARMPQIVVVEEIACTLVSDDVDPDHPQGEGFRTAYRFFIVNDANKRGIEVGRRRGGHKNTFLSDEIGRSEFRFFVRCVWI